MKNILTVDLEDWFSVEAFETVYEPKQWDDLTPVVERATDKILGMLARRRLRATFFVLGWVADRHPALIGRVADAGHEIACHSYFHQMVSSLTPEEFRRDTEMALDAIGRACGVRPIGYRSPTWGMRRDLSWAYDILSEYGFRYDSSVFPIRHDLYGDPGAPDRAYPVRLSSGRMMIEIPASTIKAFGLRLPLGGGGWLRQFPYWYTRWAIRKLNREGVPAMVYFHPWEMASDLPRVKLSLKNRIRQYGNLNTMEIKVENLLNDFEFGPIGDYITVLESQSSGKAE